MVGGGVKNEDEAKVAATESEEEESQESNQEKDTKEEEEKEDSEEEKPKELTPAKSVHEIDDDVEDVEEEKEEQTADVAAAEESARKLLAGTPNDDVNPDLQQTLPFPQEVEVESYWRVASQDEKSEEPKTETIVDQSSSDHTGVGGSKKKNDKKNGDDNKRQTCLEEMSAAVWSSRKETDVKGEKAEKIEKILNSEEKNKGQAFKDSISSCSDASCLLYAHVVC